LVPVLFCTLVLVVPSSTYHVKSTVWLEVMLNSIACPVVVLTGDCGLFSVRWGGA